MPAVWFRASGSENSASQTGLRPFSRFSADNDPTVRQRTSDCLFVLVPGFLDTPDTYAANDFPRRIRAATGCDSVAVDAHFRYYGTNVADLIYRDVIFPAERRGYQKIWLLGISMGGMGSLMVAAQHTQAIAGIVLLAPHLGEGHVINAVKEAGGLAAWQPDPDTHVAMSRGWSDRNYSEHVWNWLRGYSESTSTRPPLFMAWGDSDHLREPCELVAAVLPSERAAHRVGGHNWATWTPLLEELLPRVAASIRPR